MGTGTGVISRHGGGKTLLGHVSHSKDVDFSTQGLGSLCRGSRRGACGLIHTLTVSLWLPCQRRIEGRLGRVRKTMQEGIETIQQKKFIPWK